MSDAVEVCPECDIADCRHIRSRRDISRITDLKAQLAANDALIREMVGAVAGMLRHACVADAGADMKDPEDHEAERVARAALTRAKEMGYE